MPCDTSRFNQQQREEALRELDAKIQAEEIQVQVDKLFGTIKLQGWTEDPLSYERAGWGDACVLEALKNRGSFFTRQKIESAVEQLSPQQRLAYQSHGHSH